MYVCVRVWCMVVVCVRRKGHTTCATGQTTRCPCTDLQHIAESIPQLFGAKVCCTSVWAHTAHQLANSNTVPQEKILCIVRTLIAAAYRLWPRSLL